MRVSSRSDYGVRALYELALRYGTGPVQSREIAKAQHVPEAYLHQVLSALNRGGLVTSTRGPTGGHQLARNPEEVNLYDAMVVLDGIDAKAHPHPPGVNKDPVHAVWHELFQKSIDYLKDITLADLVERSRQDQLVPNYSI